MQTLPTVGKKSAIRFAYHLVLKDSFGALKLAHAIESAVRNIRKCEQCGSISEHEICEICLDEYRDGTILCIVESQKDLFVVESNGSYDGVYFVLDELSEESVQRLIVQIEQNDVKEVIFALTPSVANDGLILYVEDRLKDLDLNFSRIAQGVPTGVSLENVDMISLARALESRVKV